MWWWNFDKKEPLQEDLVVYEKFQEMLDERERMTQEKERQKAAARKRGSVTGGTRYSIPDPHQ